MSSTLHPHLTVPVERDVVYLHQFPRNAFVPNLSPFCLKVETFLRIHNIRYELRESWTKRSETGQLPFIELNGQVISDSQVILFRLMEHFRIQDKIPSSSKAIGRAIDRMFDGSTYYALINDKVINNSTQFASKDVTGMPVPSFLRTLMAGRFAKKVRARIAGGIGTLSNEDLMEVMRRDVDAVATILDDKEYLFGDVMSVADCTVFAHLASTYYLPFPQYIQELLNEDYPSLREYVERIRDSVYADMPRIEKVIIQSRKQSKGGN